MKKDIPENIVKDVAVAVVKEKNDKGEVDWSVYLINLKNEPIEGVLVTSSGYGGMDNESVKTSTLRHFLDVVPARSFTKIEPIMENVFGLNNEYWVSFYINREIYDKRYIFLPESIREEHFIEVPLIHKEGVMIL